MNDERLSKLYKISASEPVGIENLRRKYTYMLGSMMGSHNIWHGGSMAELHQGVKKKSKICRLRIPRKL